MKFVLSLHAFLHFNYEILSEKYVELWEIELREIEDL